MRAVKVVHEVLALLQLLRELVDRLAIARDLAGAAGDGLVPGGESGALLLDLSAAGGHGQLQSHPADPAGREQADRGKLRPAREMDELTRAAGTPGTCTTRDQLRKQHSRTEV